MESKLGHETGVMRMRDQLVRVDLEIMPVLKWMYTFPSVETLFSCQGEDSRRYHPYVLFTCENEDLIKMLSILQIDLNGNYDILCYGHIGVDAVGNKLRYRLQFEDTSYRIAFTHYLSLGKLVYPDSFVKAIAKRQQARTNV